MRPATVESSRDAPAPKFGPGFLSLAGLAYRLEMAAATIAVLALLFYWRLLVVRDLDMALTLFWIVWPDLGAFLPMGLAMRRTRAWPTWGSSVYNVLHSFLPWAAVFVLWSAAVGAVEWPLLGWAGHITADRAVGYYLRSRAAG
jgi:hypothetical protein